MVLRGKNGRKVEDRDPESERPEENQQAYQCIGPSVMAARIDRNIKSTE